MESPTPRQSASLARSDSASSSSSERTARPAEISLPLSSARLQLPQRAADRKGKGRATTTTGSTESVPRHIEVNHREDKAQTNGFDSVARASKRFQDWLRTNTELLPGPIRERLRSLSTYQIVGTAIGLPIMALVFTLLAIKRRRKRGILLGPELADVRARLAMARQRGFLTLLWIWLRWWAGKFLGIWQLATTITYF